MRNIKNTLTELMKNNLALLALILVSFFIYIPSLSGDFVLDDVPLISENPKMSGNHMADFFRKGLGGNTELENNNVPLYRPLVLVIFSWSHSFWKDNPAGYHGLLLLLHLLNIALVYIFIRKTVAVSTLAVALGAATFALHPARVESVAWISGIPDVLVVFFLLLALLAHRSFNENAKKWGYFILSLFCLQLALWSKEVAIIFPLVVIAHDVIYREKINWFAASMQVLLVGVFLIARNIALGQAATWDAISAAQLPKVLDLVLGYGEMMVFPIHIPLYMQLPSGSVSSALGWFSVIAIITLVALTWRSLGTDDKAKKAIVFSAIWVIALSWPIVLITLYMKGYAARFLYVPAVGVAIFTAILCSHLLEKYSQYKIPIITSFTMLIVLYGAGASKEIPAWQTDGAIYRKIIAAEPEGASGYKGLGDFYRRQEDYAAAEKNYLISLQKATTSYERAISLVALGTIYGMANKIEESAYYLSEAVQIEPNNSEALAGLGNLAFMQKRYFEAISYYEKAIGARPSNFQAAMNLAMAYDRIGQPERAELIRRAHRK